jgi:hypothetical protein
VQRTNHERLRASSRQYREHGAGLDRHREEDGSDSASWHGGSLQSEHGSESGASVEERGVRLNVQQHCSPGRPPAQQSQQGLLPAEVALLQQLGADLAAHVGYQQRKVHASSPAEATSHPHTVRLTAGPSPHHQEPVFLDNPMYAGYRKEARAATGNLHGRQGTRLAAASGAKATPRQHGMRATRHRHMDSDSSDGDDQGSSASSSEQQHRSSLIHSPGLAVPSALGFGDQQPSPATAAAWVRDNPMFEHKAAYSKALGNGNAASGLHATIKHGEGLQRAAGVPASPGRPLHEALQDLLSDEC